MATESACDELKMYIFVRKGLKPGKALSQAGHAIFQIVDELSGALKEFGYESLTGCLDEVEHLKRYSMWRYNPTKIVLSATWEQLISLSTMHEATIIAELEGGVHVPMCVAFRPRTESSFTDIVKQYKLM